MGTLFHRHENELAVLTPKTGLSGADPASLHIQFTLNQSMDEFDVFMDAINRRVRLTRLRPHTPSNTCMLGTNFYLC